MAEIEINAHAYAVDMSCDSCGIGFMRPSGQVAWLVSPIQYPHECNNPECKAKGAYLERYPQVKFRVG